MAWLASGRGFDVRVKSGTESADLRGEGESPPVRRASNLRHIVGVMFVKAVTLVAAAAAFAFGATLAPVEASASPPPVAASAASAISSTPVAPRRIITGWMPYWSTNSALASIVANQDLFTEVSPFWYTTSWDAKNGRTKIVSHIDAMGATAKATATKTLASTRTRVVPSVTDSTPAHRMAAVLRSPSLRAAHVAQLVAVVTSNRYAGIDLDYEKFAFSDGSSTWATTRPAWVLFVRDLARALHARGKILTVAVPEMFNSSRSGGSGYWVYDYAGMGPYVDRIRIMAYDYSWTIAGPIGPYPWAERIVKYAVSVMSPSKVQLGLPTYGRNWVRRDASNRYLRTGVCPVDNPADYNRYTYNSNDIPAFMARVGVPRSALQWSATSKEHWFRYSRVYSGKTSSGTATSCRVYREVWFGDADSVTARMGLVGKYQLAGLAFWTLGDEDTRQWSRLRTYARSIVAKPTAVSVRAPIRTRAGAIIRISASSSSLGKPVVGAYARLLWQRVGRPQWIELGHGITSARGTVKFLHASPAINGKWVVAIGGTWSRSAGVSRPATTAVRATVSARLSALSVRRGKVARLSGVVTPGRAGQIVVRQRLINRRWVDQATATTNKFGAVSFRLVSHRHGVHYTYRLVSNSTVYNARGYSHLVTLRIV